ncbi:MAG TPA: cytochrome c oxidase subunit II [Thermoguttaceae bacterium]|nr:cytochrome c oxidase subunit II [Thermoguttaceae bacterium]
MMLAANLSRMTAGPAMTLWAQAHGSFWLPPQGSTTAGAVDTIFNLIFWISAFFFALIVSLLIFFVVRYRRREGVEPGKTASHNLALELTWSAIPFALVVLIFYQSVIVYMDVRTAPREAYEIRVIGQKWKWSFRYPNGYVDENLHVPVGEPVRLLMTSKDVIHSLSIPDFRLKMDLVPGRDTKTWFNAVQPGTHDLYCTEYCGTGHSSMLASVIVHPSGQFKTWLEGAANFLDTMAPAEAGELLVQRRGCLQCHKMDGSRLIGPSFKGIFGEQHRFTDGSSVLVDENYIRQSILEPSAKIRESYRDEMPTYLGILSDDEIDAIIAYIKSLK